MERRLDKQRAVYLKQAHSSQYLRFSSKSRYQGWRLAASKTSEKYPSHMRRYRTPKIKESPRPVSVIATNRRGTPAFVSRNDSQGVREIMAKVVTKAGLTSIYDAEKTARLPRKPDPNPLAIDKKIIIYHRDLTILVAPSPARCMRR